MQQQLIENALALCGKTMEDVMEIESLFTGYIFSIEKFCYFLLSPEFLDNYIQIEPIYQGWFLFGQAIHEYQSGNEKPLIELLNKINAKPTTTTR